jgi:cell division protease FtsH
MSDRLGALSYMEEEGEVFLGRSVTQHKNVSDETAHVIDAEIRAVIDRNYQRARTILVENMDILHAMSEALLKYETIDVAQIDNLMARREPGEPKGWNEDGQNPPQAGGGVSAGSVDVSKEPASKPVSDPAGQH